MGDVSLASVLDVGQGVSLHEPNEESKATDKLAPELGQNQDTAPQIIQDEGKETKSSKSQKARINRLEKRKACRLQVKRLQQYLGLAQAPVAATGPAALYSSSSTEQEASTTNPDSYAVLVSVDCEAYEFMPKYITEIGVSVLDTRDIIGVEPGLEGENWVCKIKSRHFRTEEHRHRRNKRHVQGFPDNFMFGQSEWIFEKNAAEVLRQCFRQYSPAIIESSSSNPCKVVFIGHNAASDEHYLAGLGFDLSKEAVDVIDSEVMAMAVFRETRRLSLGNLLLRYGINGEYFHNAGNDARYALHVAIAIALTQFRSKKTEAEWQVEHDIRVKGAIEKATGKVVDELDSGTKTSNDTSKSAPELEKIAAKIEQACEEAVAKVNDGFEGWSTEDDDEVEGSAILPRSCEEVLAKLASNKRKKQANKAAQNLAQSSEAGPAGSG